ncbi:MAG: BsuBI/PstI family type II restriction endonuclease [Rhodopila sp.]|jgi:hypothetical protein
MGTSLPPLLPVDEIRQRLIATFPDGIPNREHIVKPNTARVVFCSLYIGAIEGSDRWFAPRHLYRMTDDLAGVADPDIRLSFYKRVPKSSNQAWYADNSREGARDEGVRRGLIPLNAMIKRQGVDTTSSKGRYALHPAFSALFDPALTGSALLTAIEAWQNTYLTGAARARAALAGTMDDEGITVVHPQGGSTLLPAGESPLITKAVVEEFSKRFLARPAVVWISDSAIKRFSDDRLNQVLQIKLDAASLLPDVILVDRAPPGLKLVFVEVVSTDGTVTEQRKADILKLLAASAMGYEPEDAIFVTAYRDRGSRPVPKALRELAWNSFAWFMSEPDHLVQLHNGPPRLLSQLIRPARAKSP